MVMDNLHRNVATITEAESLAMRQGSAVARVIQARAILGAESVVIIGGLLAAAKARGAFPIRLMAPSANAGLGKSIVRGGFRRAPGGFL